MKFYLTRIYIDFTVLLLCMYVLYYVLCRIWCGSTCGAREFTTIGSFVVRNDYLMLIRIK